MTSSGIKTDTASTAAIALANKAAQSAMDGDLIPVCSLNLSTVEKRRNRHQGNKNENGAKFLGLV
jgi:hypothetical protein